jgi:glycosyltransferase involved in cell wall biosynthesis
MAMRTVPVVSNVGDLRDFAINGETGYAIDEEDKEGFITTIVELLSDERRRAYLAANARQLVVEKCDRDILSKRWSDILNDLRN